MLKCCWLCTCRPATCCWYSLYSSIHLRASLACAATCWRHTRHLQTCICRAHTFLSLVRLKACNSCLMAPKRAITDKTCANTLQLRRKLKFYLLLSAFTSRCLQDQRQSTHNISGWGESGELWKNKQSWSLLIQPSFQIKQIERLK